MRGSSDRIVFESLVQDLSPWIKDGEFENGRQNVQARVKVGITSYYMAHSGDGINLGCMSGLKNNSALKYLQQVCKAICTHLAPKWMGNRLLNRPGYMDQIQVQAQFRLRNGVANVVLCIDGTHIPYKQTRESMNKTSKIISSGLLFSVLDSSTASIYLLI